MRANLAALGLNEGEDGFKDGYRDGCLAGYKDGFNYGYKHGNEYGNTRAQKSKKIFVMPVREGRVAAPARPLPRLPGQARPLPPFPGPEPSRPLPHFPDEPRPGSPVPPPSPTLRPLPPPPRTKPYAWELRRRPWRYPRYTTTTGSTSPNTPSHRDKDVFLMSYNMRPLVPPITPSYLG